MKMTTLQEFMATGMAFFKSKSQEQTNADLVAAFEKQKLELEAAHGVVVESLRAELEELKQTFSEKTTALAALEKEFVSAGAQAQAALVAAGVPPVVVPAEPVNIAPKGFVELVHERIATGKSKAEAIGFCIKNFPQAYLEARQSGGLGKI